MIETKGIEYSRRKTMSEKEIILFGENYAKEHGYSSKLYSENSLKDLTLLKILNNFGIILKDNDFSENNLKNIEYSEEKIIVLKKEFQNYFDQRFYIVECLGNVLLHLKYNNLKETFLIKNKIENEILNKEAKLFALGFLMSEFEIKEYLKKGKSFYDISLECGVKEDKIKERISFF